jgi:hypothetical protein
VTKGDAFVLSPGAKRFLSDLLKEMYNGLQLDLDKITIRFVDSLNGFVGRYDPPSNPAEGGLLRLVRAKWEKKYGRRMLQLMLLAHELVHAYQAHLYRFGPVDAPQHNSDAEEQSNPRWNYTLPQKLLQTDIGKLNKRDLTNTEDQLGQRLMYEIAKRLGDEREYTEHWRLEPAPAPDLPGGP